jgi:hypothetical protein
VLSRQAKQTLRGRRQRWHAMLSRRRSLAGAGQEMRAWDRGLASWAMKPHPSLGTEQGAADGEEPDGYFKLFT